MNVETNLVEIGMMQANHRNQNQLGGWTDQNLRKQKPNQQQKTWVSDSRIKRRILKQKMQPVMMTKQYQHRVNLVRMRNKNKTKKVLTAKIRKAGIPPNAQSKTHYAANKKKTGKEWEQNFFNDSGADLNLVGGARAEKD